MALYLIRYVTLIPALVLLVQFIGCAHPDQWAVFKDEPQVPSSREAFRPVEIHERLQPRLIEPPSFELAGDRIDLSVEQTTMLALQNNRDLQVRQLTPVITGTFEQLERGVFDPELFADFEYLDEKTSETSRSTGAQFEVKGKDTAVVAGIRQRLPTGAMIEATVGQERTISSRTPEQQTARLGLSLTQSLLRGFGPAVNLVSVRQAELETMASVYELRGFTEALLADTERAYWHYVLAEQEIAIFEESLAVAKQQLHEVEERIDVGVMPRIEAAVARSEVARREQGLINARSNLEERRLRLLRLVSPAPTGRLDLKINATSEVHIEPESITDLGDRLQLAEQFRPDLNEARLRVEQNRLETVLTRNGLLPRLELFVDLGQTGFSDTFSDSFREVDGDTYDFRAGVRFSQYLGNRTANARDIAAHASRQQAVEAVANLQQLVQLDVRLAVNEVDRAGQLVAASRVTRELQEKTLQGEKDRFDVGAGTGLLVAQAQRDLLVSSIAAVEAIVNYRIALIALYLAEGSLLERRGVTLAAGEISSYAGPDWTRVDRAE